MCSNILYRIKPAASTYKYLLKCNLRKNYIQVDLLFSCSISKNQQLVADRLPLTSQSVSLIKAFSPVESSGQRSTADLLSFSSALH